MKNFWIFILLLSTTCIFSQNVGINTTGATPSINAILDLNTGNANKLGLIIPNVTLGASLATFNPPIANAPTAGDKGMMVYNSVATNQPIGYYYWNGATWVSLSGGGGGVTSVTATAPVFSSGGTTPNITLQGTAGTVCYGTGGGSNFNAVGTTGQILQSAGAGTPIWTNLDTYAEAYIINGAVGGNVGVFTINSVVNATILSVVAPSSGTYLIVSSCEVATKASAPGPYVELSDGGAIVDEQCPYEAFVYTVSYGWYPCAWVKEETVISGTIFSLIGAESFAGDIGYVRNAHLCTLIK